MKAILQKRFLLLLSLFITFNIYAQNLKLGKESIGQNVKLTQAQLLELSLPSDKSSCGYSWVVNKIDESVIKQFGDWVFVKSAKGKIVGAPGTQVIKFAAQSQGTCEIELVYKRAWESDDPIANYKITITTESAYVGKESPYFVPRDTSSNTSRYNSKSGLPSSFDWGSSCNIMTVCKNQKQCGDCWAFAAMGVFEALIKYEDGNTRDLSEQWLADCDLNESGCGGGWCPFNFLVNSPGVVYEADDPYTSGTAGAAGICGTSYTHYEQPMNYKDITYSLNVANIDTIKSNIYKHGPLWAAMDASPSQFDIYSAGVYTVNSTSGVDHAIVLYGWNDNGGTNGYWLLRNSWGTNWGISGNMQIKYGVSMVGTAPHYLTYKTFPVCNTAGAVTNIEDVNIKFNIYPNPSNGKVNFDFNNKDKGKYTIEIYNLVGQVVFTDNIIKENTQIRKSYDLSDLKKGIYLAKISCNNYTYSNKLVIE